MATKDLTKGSPFKLIILFMIPVFLGIMFQQFYQFVDAVVVGRSLGVKSLAAIGSTSSMIFFVISFIFSSTQGFTVVLAQKFGAGDYDQVRRSLAISIILSFILMLVITVIFTPCTRLLLELLSTPEDIIEEASEYLWIMFIGIFATVFYNLSSNVIRAVGDSKTPLYFLIFSSFLNIIFDLLFIIKFKMGISGAGWATVLSQFISTILCVFYMFARFPILRLSKKDWIVDRKFMLEHVKIGIPMGIQMSVLTLGLLVVQYVTNLLGSTAVAAVTTAMRVDQIFGQVFVALGTTIATYTAQNFGAKQYLRIREGTHVAIKIIVSTAVFTIVILSLFSESILSIFMNEIDHEVIRLGTQFLHTIMIFYACLGFILTYRNVLQGMGKVTIPLITGFVELAVRGTSGYILGTTYGFIGVCLASPLAWIAGASVLYYGYKINIKEIKKKIGMEEIVG